MGPNIQALIDHFHFETLPAEGTFYSSTWRSKNTFTDGSPHGTAMIGMYCNVPLSQSVFHRLPVDEVWHFYGGDPLRLVLLYPDGSHSKIIMGGNPLNGQAIQYTIPAGTWQGGYLLEGGHYALFGCTMAPGFTGSMYEGACRTDLLTEYPECKEDILRLTNESAEKHMPAGFST